MPVLRSMLIALSRSSRLRRTFENSSLGRSLASRFVAGATVEEAVQVAGELWRAGAASTLDSLGENVTSPEQVAEAAAICHRLLDAIGHSSIDAHVSVKPTQMGIDREPALARETVAGLTRHASAGRSFICVDMEGSAYTQSTLDLVRELHGRAGNRGHIGAVIQAYLRRSADDVAALIAEGVRIRLCKGAYLEPATVAFPNKADVDANFVRLMQTLLGSGQFHSIATHDERMIAATKRFSRECGIPADAFEFQMLYGVRRDLQQLLIDEGYRLRVYVPFGSDWYPYFMRRLAERPANVLFVAENLLRGSRPLSSSLPAARRR